MNSLKGGHPLPPSAPKVRAMKLWLRFAIPTGLVVMIAIIAVTSMNIIFAQGANTNHMTAFSPAQLQTIQQNLSKQHQADLKKYKGIQQPSQEKSSATHSNLTGPPPTFDNIAISYDTSTTLANFDGTGNSYSYTALQEGGLFSPEDNSFRPYIYDGITFKWFNMWGSYADNYQANGQVLAVTPVNNATTLGFIGASSGGNLSGTATITYTDSSTQNFQLAMSDWTLNGNKAIPSFGNRLYALYPHRNTQTGQQNSYTYLFYVPIELQAGKTVQSLTLPSSVNKGQIHLFGISTNTTEYAINTGAAHDGELTAFTNFDGSDNAYSIEAVRQYAKDRYLFDLIESLDGITPDNYIAAGQNIPLSTSNNSGTKVVFLGSATGGTSSGSVTLTYDDGSTQIERLAFSDWCVPQTLASTGDQIAEAMPYRNTLAGKQYTKNYLYYAELPIDAQKTLVSVTLPNPAQGQGTMHIFYVDLGGGDYNNVGISDDTIPFAANFDGTGNSYSEQALVKAGLTQKTGYYNYNGIYFRWSEDPQNVLDNQSGQHQTIFPYSSDGGATGATTLAFLGSATNGNSSGIATIHYSDGSTQTFTMGMSDWTLNGNRTQPAFGNKIVATMPYRNTKTGQQNKKNYMFFAQVSLQPAKTLVNVTLPSTTGGTMHIFSSRVQ